MEPNTTTQMVQASTLKEVEYIPLGNKDPIKLSIAIVRKFIAQKTRQGHEASDAEIMKFIMLCRARALDPWQGDAYLLGYDSQDGPTFTLITAYQAFLKRAEVSTAFDGMQSGVICNDGDGNIIEYEGDFVQEGHILLGGWAKAFRSDRKFPFYRRAKLSTYNNGKSRWKIDPAGMVCKVAEADALRSAFPTSMGGMYMAEEMVNVIDVADQGLVATKATRGKPSNVKLPTFTVSDPEPTKAPPEPQEGDLGPQEAPAAVVTTAPVQTPPEPTVGVKQALWERITVNGFDMTSLLEVCAANPILASKSQTWGSWDDVSVADATEIMKNLVIEGDQMKWRSKRVNGGKAA